MTASSSKTPNAVATGNNGAPYVHQQACLFGANGAGKSGLVASIKTFGLLVRDSFKDVELLIKNYEPHLFHSEWRNKPTEFEIAFLHDDSLFQYGFTYDAERILEEWLFERPSATRKQRRIFSREYDPKNDAYEWETNPTYLKGERQSWQAQTREDALFISTAIQLNAEPLKRPFSWLSRKLQVILAEESIENYTVGRLNEESWKAKVLAFLADVDFRLEDVVAEERALYETARFKNLPVKQQKALRHAIPEEAKTWEVYTYRNDEKGTKVLLDFENESSGTRALFALIGPIMDSLEKGHTLIVDELNVHLHPLALRHLMCMFSSPNTNPREAQIIFTTHDPTVTEEEGIGRDQIWLVEKGDDWASRLTPFSDYKTRNKQSFQKGYLQGRYGAIPCLVSP
ncbi:MAG: ATP-binding protein [Gammaproteobacteria bacterium]|nr:ATP-binding protein [Gammaproteobacteria bacterium]